jgi:exodeoxyribonuclease V gamma subunit
MLLGSALPADPRELVLGIFPFDEIGGSNAELLGNFVDCLEALFACAADFAQPRSLQEWQRVLINALDQFLEPGEPRQIELTQLRTGLAQMEKIAAVSENDDPVSLEIAKLQLKYSLGESHIGFLGGALTFSALTSAVPAKVLCLLGLNDNAFPGRDNSAEFDLIAQTRRCGDRNRRDDDRAFPQRFSARETFFT